MTYNVFGGTLNLTQSINQLAMSQSQNPIRDYFCTVDANVSKAK